MNNLKDEKLKDAVDIFGRLSFVLETYVKLRQTGDHPVTAEMLLKNALLDAEHLVEALDTLIDFDHEQA